MRRISAPLMIGAFAAVVTGCASSKVALKPHDVAQLKTVSEIPAVHAQQATLRVVTVGKAMSASLFGIVGGLVADGMARSDGKDFVKAYGLDDPAGRVKEGLAAALAERLVLNNLRAVSTPVEDIDANTLRRAFRDSVVLAVKTDQWSISYVDLASHYGIVYFATARLVRTVDGTLLSNASCRLDGRDFGKATMEELTADNGALLRRRIEQTADVCVNRLIGDLLSRETLNAALSK
jgi:hypothetical protein